MEIQTLQDGDQSFNVSVREAPLHSRVVLFAVGAGGQPERYTSLLDALAGSGCTVIAPHVERLASSVPNEEELTLRARRLSLALDVFSQSSAKVMAVGHSIGAASLIALAGAQMWLGPGRCVDIALDSRLTRLALLAPPTGFFQAPGALDAVEIPIRAWVGSADKITPPSDAKWLAHAMRNRNEVDVCIAGGADHFSFMDIPPPQTIELLPNKHTFLRDYSNEVCDFLVG